MHVRRVRIKNIRGFTEVDLDFSRPDGSLAGWTVLAGRNGSGKSTFLKAIALAVSGVELTRPLLGGFGDWIRSGTAKAQVEIDLTASAGCDIYNDEAHSLAEDLKVGLLWTLSDRRSEPRLGASVSANGDVLFGPWSTHPQGWFIAGYGPYRRLPGNALEAMRVFEEPPRLAALVSLFSENSSLAECVTWLREIYLRRLEKKPGAQDLEDAVLDLLKDGLLPDKVLVENIDSEGLWVRQYGARLPLTQLSDGYRTTAALIMDLVRHLHRSYGELKIEQSQDDEGLYQRVLHEGVVLIDEVDLHLHVSWQKRIGFWLKRHFPNIQFIVTTHSPFVCQAADPRGLIRLPAPGEDRPVEHVSEELYNTVVNGSADDAVLTELFGLETSYSEESERLRERVAQLEALLQSGKAKEKDRKELSELRSRLPQTLTSDVDQALRKLAADG